MNSTRLEIKPFLYGGFEVASEVVYKWGPMICFRQLEFKMAGQYTHISSTLPNKENCSRGFLLGFTCGILGGPSVDQRSCRSSASAREMVAGKSEASYIFPGKKISSNTQREGVPCSPSCARSPITSRIQQLAEYRAGAELVPSSWSKLQTPHLRTSHISARNRMEY